MAVYLSEDYRRDAKVLNLTRERLLFQPDLEVEVIHGRYGNVWGGCITYVRTGCRVPVTIEEAERLRILAQKVLPKKDSDAMDLMYYLGLTVELDEAENPVYDVVYIYDKQSQKVK